MLLGIHGKMGSGKDTVLARLQVISDKFTRHAFADKLKISAMASLGFRNDPNDPSGEYQPDGMLVAMANSLKENGDITIHFTHNGQRILTRITGREYLQFKGTEGGRDVFGTDFWVEQAMDPAIEAESDGKIPVLTDVRFENEAEALVDWEGEVWRVIGDNEDTGDHASEHPLAEKWITDGVTVDNTNRTDGYASLDAQLERLVKERIEDT